MQKATAIGFDKEVDNAPNIVAQGKGAVASNIIKIAKQNDIPIKKDEDLVNMLSEIELNTEIPVELYQAVSEVFSFIYSITNEENKTKEEFYEKEIN